MENGSKGKMEELNAEYEMEEYDVQDDHLKFLDTLNIKVSREINGFRLERLLGVGGFAAVFQVRNMNTMDSYAMKIIVKQSSKKDYILDKEELIMKYLMSQKNVSKNILLAHQLFSYKNQSCLIMEMMACDLNRLIQIGKFSIDSIRDLSRQLAQGIKFLHSKGIIHRDLKSENILLQGSLENVKVINSRLETCGKINYKVSDFGCSIFNDRTNKEALVGTPGIMPPEALDLLTYNQSYDSWSFGCILIHAYTGIDAFYSSTLREQKQDIKNFKVNIAKAIEKKCAFEGQDLKEWLQTENVTIKKNRRFDRSILEFYKLVNGLLAYETHARLSMKEVLKHKFVTETGQKIRKPIKRIRVGVGTDSDKKRKVT